MPEITAKDGMLHQVVFRITVINRLSSVVYHG